MEALVKSLGKDLFQILIVVVTLGYYCGGIRSDLTTIATNQTKLEGSYAKLMKDSEEDRKVTTTQIQAIEQRQATTEVLLKEVQERLDLIEKATLLK